MAIKSVVIFLALMIQFTQGGRVGYAICYARCISLATACYAAAGFTFTYGSIPSAVPIGPMGANPALIACNAAFGVCEAGCMAAHG